MDPEALKNVPPYLVLAYNIAWDLEMDGKITVTQDEIPPSYVLLDMRSYQRPQDLGEVALFDAVFNLLTEMYDFCIKDLKIKVVEA